MKKTIQYCWFGRGEKPKLVTKPKETKKESDADVDEQDVADICQLP